MRYFLTGFILFLLMAVFVRSWYVHQFDKPQAQEFAQANPTEDLPKAVFSSYFILDDNLLLKPSDYKVIENAVEVLKKKDSAKLVIAISEALNAPKIKNTLSLILEDQGIEATRFQFLRKPTKSIGLHKVFFQVL